MKRIVFLDYIRVFACFLVMLVHAAENFYGAPGSTDMAGPQSLLLTESDRLWVSLYDGFSRMSVPLFMIVSAFLLVPMREGQSAMEFYRRRAVRILLRSLFLLFFIALFRCCGIRLMVPLLLMISLVRCLISRRWQVISGLCIRLSVFICLSR